VDHRGSNPRLAFKACHQLPLAVPRVSEQLEERDAELAGQLWAAALIASIGRPPRPTERQFDRGTARSLLRLLTKLANNL